MAATLSTTLFHCISVEYFSCIPIHRKFLIRQATVSQNFFTLHVSGWFQQVPESYSTPFLSSLLYTLITQVGRFYLLTWFLPVPTNSPLTSFKITFYIPVISSALSSTKCLVHQIAQFLECDLLLIQQNLPCYDQLVYFVLFLENAALKQNLFQRKQSVEATYDTICYDIIQYLGTYYI